MRVYVVQKGDSLWKIAKRHGLTLDALITANPQLPDPNAVNIGERINLPMEDTASTHGAPSAAAGYPYNMPTWQYVVKKGDTMWKISQQLGVPLDALTMANPQVHNPAMIMPGQVIQVPGNAPSIAAPLSSMAPMSVKANTAPMPKISTAPIIPPAAPQIPPLPPMAPQIHVDANLNYTEIKEETKITKMKPTPPSVAKIYVKEEVVKQAPVVKQPVGDQVICWDPCNPPPEGPLFEGPFIPASPFQHPSMTYGDAYQTAPLPYAKTVKIRESSSLWHNDSSWLRESSSR